MPPQAQFIRNVTLSCAMAPGVAADHAATPASASPAPASRRRFLRTMSASPAARAPLGPVRLFQELVGPLEDPDADAAVRRPRPVNRAGPPPDEVPGRALAVVVDQGALEDEGLLQRHV